MARHRRKSDWGDFWVKHHLAEEKLLALTFDLLPQLGIGLAKPPSSIDAEKPLIINDLDSR